MGSTKRTTAGRAASRSRWAAFGAAVAITLGGGGLYVANATADPGSTFVAIEPTRVLDSRTYSPPALLFNAGQPFCVRLAVESPAGCEDGAVAAAGATAIVLNVTVVDAEADGYVTVRPAGLQGPPATSTVNFAAGEIEANMATVLLPTSGQWAGAVDIGYYTYGPEGVFPDGSTAIQLYTTDIVVDVLGYYVGPPG
ncbi:MAG: hypothetical protein ACR2O6_13235 [Ilumatobacteraceae bacterium]